MKKDLGSPRAPLPCPGRPYLGSGLRAVILATMMLSGRGVATALKVPLQNFSKSCFSPCCTPAMAPRPPGSPAAVRGAERYIPGPARSPARCGECGPGRPRLPFCAGGAGRGAGPAAVPSPAPPPPQLRPEPGARSPARGGEGAAPGDPLGSCPLTPARCLPGGSHPLAPPGPSVRHPHRFLPQPRGHFQLAGLGAPLHFALCGAQTPQGRASPCPPAEVARSLRVCPTRHK